MSHLSMLHRYLISPKWKLKNNIDVTDYFAGDNEICEYRPKSAAYFGSEISITGCARGSVRQHCVNGDRPTQWAMANRNP